MKPGNILIDVWSDYVCPFCYLAEPTLARLEQEFKDVVRVAWHAFELRPDPVPTLDPQGDYLRKVWQQSVHPMAEARGMLLRLPPVQPRSRLAHETAAFAREQGKFTDVNDGLFRAFFVQGLDIGKIEVLEQIVLEAGLDPVKLRIALHEGRHRQTVVEDEAIAHKLEISGVPATLVRPASDPLENAVLVEGAQPLKVFQRAVTAVINELRRR